MTWLTALAQVESHAEASARRQFGGKAVSLARLAAIGYPVPASWVISTEAVSKIRQLEGGALPAGLLEEIADKTRDWRRYAVRSSAIHEDGETRSWAGVLESFVDIGLDGIEDAIRRCLASLYSPASLSYAARQSLAPQDLAMAVIVQEFIDGQVCGVGFSIDPVNHYANAVTLDASPAAGQVTDGSLIPDHYTVEKLTGRILEARKGPREEYALSRLAAIEIAGHIARLEREFGSPVDVEWTLKDGVFVPLQSRCVTTPRPPGAAAILARQAYRFWWLDADAWWQCEAGMRSFETEGDVAANHLADVVYLREGGSSRCLISADDVMRLTEIGLDLRSKEKFQHFEAQGNECLASTQEAQRALDGLAADLLAPADLCTYLRAIDAAFRRCVSLYRMCDPYVTSAVFAAAARFIPARELIELIAPSEPNRAQEAGDWSLLAGREFDEALAWEHARKHPWLVPNLYRRDTILAGLRQKHRAAQGQGKRRSSADRRAFDAAGLPGAAQVMLSNLRGLADMRLRLKLAFTSFDFPFVTLYQSIYQITGVPAEALHARYSIADMIDLLSHGSKQAASPPRIGHLQGGRLTFVEAKHADAFWRGRVVSLDHDAAADGEIRGTVANHGKVSGRVHLLSCNDPDKAILVRQRMRDGDVLVSEMIQLNVMDLVQRAGGLVTDEGGMLSHAAILAREMGIPCIVGTQRATQALRDGDHVTIDTKQGSVKRI